MSDEIDDTPKKAKKQARKEQQAKALAASILADAEAEAAAEAPAADDTPEIPDIANETPKRFEEMPGKREEQAPPPEPIRFEQGTTKPTAFVLQRRIDEIYPILAKYFGPHNGDYFIGTDNTATSYTKEGERKRYKCISIEDKHGFRYILWFDVTRLGMIY